MSPVGVLATKPAAMTSAAEDCKTEIVTINGPMVSACGCDGGRVAASPVGRLYKHVLWAWHMLLVDWLLRTVVTAATGLPQMLQCSNPRGRG